jgi:Flp pilus assembly protein TadD
MLIESPPETAAVPPLPVSVCETPLRRTVNVVHPRVALLRHLLVLACVAAVAGAPARAQDGRELSDEARRKYTAELKEASALVRERQFDSALAKLDALLAQRPREPQARFLKGVVETEQGRTDAAISQFRALSEDYPELPEPYNNLAVLYAQKGDLNGARIALETAIRTAPDWAVARENLGDLYVRLAAAEYDRAAKLDRDNRTAPAKLLLARDLLAKGAPSTPGS